MPKRRDILTAFYLLVLGILLYVFYFPGAGDNKLQHLHYIGESAGRLMERHLEFYENYESTGKIERTLHEFLFGTKTDVETQVLDTYQEVLKHFEEYPRHATTWAAMNTRARLLVTIAEKHGPDELETALTELGNNPEEEAIAIALRFAYLEQTTDVPPIEIHSGSSLLPIGWARDHLRMRIAYLTDDKFLYNFIKQRRLAAGERLRDRVWNLAITISIIIILGLIVLFKERILNIAAPWQDTILDNPWTIKDGFAVAVRSALLGILISIGIHQFTAQYFKPGILVLWSTLFASLPMLWLIYHSLLKPAGLRFKQAFGLYICNVGWRRFGGITITFLAIEWLGLMIIGWTTWKLGLGGHWAEGVQERMVFGPDQTVILISINIVIWAAIFEEIGFRGLVYTSLRSWISPKIAIPISALLFSSLHLYSLAGFLSVFWSGLVLAYVYERYGSLLPGITIHAIGNMLNLSTVLLFYR